MRTTEFILLSCTVVFMLGVVGVAGYFRVRNNGISFTKYRLIVGAFAMIAAVVMLCIASILGIK